MKTKQQIRDRINRLEKQLPRVGYTNPAYQTILSYINGLKWVLK